MKKHIRKSCMLLPISSLFTMTACNAIPEDVKQPNIVFILVDDMGYGDVSLLNENSKINTTHIDRLGREGVVFTDAHSSSSVSTPTCYGLLTGRYNWRSTLKSGVLGGYSKALIPPERRTMATMLKEQGYQTACIGKWHLGWDWNNIDEGIEAVDFSKPITNGPTTLGFDYFYGISGSLDMTPYVYVENDMPTAIPDRETENTGMGFWRKGLTSPDFEHEQTLPNFINRAVSYIHTNATEQKPFFLYLPLPAPHTPILPIKEYQGKSGLNPYADFVLMVDDMVGKVMQALKDANIDENTLVVFASDNGCSPWVDFPALAEKGHHPSSIYRGYKADLYEGGHRVPCLVRWPGGLSPRIVEQTICLTDFYATFASLNGYDLHPSEGEDSYDLLPVLQAGDSKGVIREATVQHSITGDFTIRKGEWKVLFSPHSGGWSYPSPDSDQEVIKTLPVVQLYNITTDPEEKENISEQYPEVVEEMRILLIKYIQEGRSTPGASQLNDGPDICEELKWIKL